MFYYLRGEIAAVEQNLLVIDCGGIGFTVGTSTHTISQVSPGQQTKLYTYCAIREAAFDIYGFATRQELETFKLLISISGVGPKVALAILSSVTPEGLQMAVVTENEKAITAAPGVGKKLAQRILLELRDKMGAGAGLSLSTDGGGTEPAGPGSKAAEAALALQALGYDQNTISRAMKHIDMERLELQDIIKQALKVISG